ncbi:MAG: bifunctional indole-3-glycerol-phosphate synthase TrpC/phosphoribosylanthranilate isomerase TrpF [Sphingomicrobium sp.]
MWRHAVADSVLAEIVRRKRQDVRARLQGLTLDPEPTRRSLRSALAQPGARFVLEVKRRSPSGHRSNAGVIEAVCAYAPVADAISVLTDEPYFGGSLDDLRAARARYDGPILAKDFVIDARQVTEARHYGADAVLGILSVLNDREAASIIAEARRLGMDVVIEVHDEAEMKRALALGSTIIGINNRDLNTLKTDLTVSERLAGIVPEDVVLVSESGIRTRADVERLSGKTDAFLVGSSLMAADNICFAARSLVSGAVKICGLTSAEDVAAVASAGATHAGFIFADDSPRKVGRDAADLTAQARESGVRAVGVFRDQDHETIAAAADACSLDAVQLHGSVVDLARLRANLPHGCEIWLVCGVDAMADPARTGTDRTLFDTRLNGRSGGTGRPFDWKLIAGRSDLPSAFLAGGIGPDNARAAQQVGTFGIDIGSALELEPGRKDRSKLAAVFDALRPQCRRSVACA